MTGIAFADDPAPDPNAGGGGGDATGAGAGATVGAEVGTDGAKVDASAGAAITLANYPLSYVDRPQTIPKGVPEISPRFQFLRITNDDGMGNTASTNITALGVGGRYGITDKIEALAAFDRIILSGVDGIETGDRLKGQLNLGAGIQVAAGKLDVEVKAGIFNELGGLGIKTLVFAAGADVRFHVNEKLWIGTPINRPGLIAGITNAKINFGGMEMEIPDSKPLEINIPLAVAFQATPELAIQVNTDLFVVNLNDASKGGPDGDAVNFIGQDSAEGGLGIPVDIDVIYGLSNKMDVRVNLDLVDLANAGDFLAITGGVNLRL